MTSLINPSNINGNFPIAGQDNDSQGFRDNFTNIKNNFTFAQSDINDLQSKVVLKSALIGGTLDNNFLGSQLQNAQLKNYSETVYDWGSTAGQIQLDFALGNVHKLIASGSVSINSVIKNWPASLQFSRILFYVSISNVSYTLQIPNTITTDLSSIPGLRYVAGSDIITFLNTGSYIFEFSSVDSGTTVFLREVTRGNPFFADPNFYLQNIGAGLTNTGQNSGYQSPTLYLGYGNILAIGQAIDSNYKNNSDVLSIHGPMTSYYSYSNTTGEGSLNPSTMQQAGYTVARSRANDPGAGSSPSQGTSDIVQNGDIIGYYNALGLVYNQASTAQTYQQLGSIQFFANGVSTANGIGGNIVIATKKDGTDGLSPAVIIDNTQGVTIYGNLDVKGTTTYIESTMVVVKDKQIVIANGSVSSDTASGAGMQIEINAGSNSFANLTYIGSTASGLTNGTWSFNLPVNVAAQTASLSANTGAMILQGGLGVAGNLNIGGNLGVGGSFSLTSTTDATNAGVGAFVLGFGGLGVAKNIMANGIISANSTAISTSTTSGALQSKGGFAVAGASFLGGNVVFANVTDASSTTVASAVFLGGVGIAGKLIANGNVTLGNSVNSSYVTGQGTVYNGAFTVRGGAHIAGNLNLGNDTNATSPRLVIWAPTGTSNAPLDPKPNDGENSPFYGNGAVIIGTGAATAGMTITGTMNLGTQSGGVLVVRNRTAAIGTITNSTPTPYLPQQQNSSYVYGAATVMGGVNIFGDLFLGQPAQSIPGGATNTSAGNLIMQSGTPSTSSSTGAIVIQKVQLQGTAGFSSGGLGMQGNLFAVGNVTLGGDGTSSTTSNVIIDSKAAATIANTGALVVRGGINVGGSVSGGAASIFNGNVVFTSGVGGNSGGAAWTTPTGSLVLAGAAGIAANGISVFGGNVVMNSGTISAGTTTGALVVSGGIGVSGAVQAGSITISGGAAGGSGAGALIISSSGGASIAGNLYVQGSVQPINAVGASGIALVNATGTAFTTTSAGATNITGLTFQTVAGGNYSFTALVPYSTSVAATVGFDVTFTSGAGYYMIETQTSLTSAFAVTSSNTSGAVVTSVIGSALTGLTTRITGTIYTAAVSTVQVQTQTSAGTLTIPSTAFLQWTRLS